MTAPSPVHGEIKELQELFERGLVHGVHQAHLHDQEVEDGAARGHGPELFARRGDLDLRLRRRLQLLAHVQRRGLGRVQHDDQVLIVHQRTLTRHQEIGIRSDLDSEENINYDKAIVSKF
jgi:hypothetical protein